MTSPETAAAFQAYQFAALALNEALQRDCAEIEVLRDVAHPPKLMMAWLAYPLTGWARIDRALIEPWEVEG